MSDHAQKEIIHVIHEHGITEAALRKRIRRFGMRVIVGKGEVYSPAQESFDASHECRKDLYILQAASVSVSNIEGR